MNKLQRYYKRGRFPARFWGTRALMAMNSKKHADMPEWALEELQDEQFDKILDIGCGGGANMKRMLNMFPGCRVTGLDISNYALNVARDLNFDDIDQGRCFLSGGSANQMPLPKETFDLATAFETVYYWSGITACFTEVKRVLKPGGIFMIGNELDGMASSDHRMELAVGLLHVYTIEELESVLTAAGFVDIKARHDEARRFICLTCRKP